MASKRKPRPARTTAEVTSSGRASSKGKSGTAPGRLFKAAGLTNASTLAPGYAKSAPRRTR